MTNRTEIDRTASFHHCRTSNGSGSALAETCHSGLSTPVIRYHCSVFYRLDACNVALLLKRALHQIAMKASTTNAAFAESP
ncbi:MAG: hypothetical protein P8Y36_09685 [Alphaproteobacteria bacterium]|jgi:hypothetical protein